MTALIWDQPGERRYETGVDHGVLYLPSGGAVPWNGLISVTETRSQDVKPYFIDGVKYLDRMIPGVYSAKLQAFTYPDELEFLLGNVEIAPGVLAHDQRARMFDLSYRTGLGNDLEGLDHAFKLHLVYHIIAVSDDAVFNTLSDSISGESFGWTLNGTPQPTVGIKPTSHISLDSRTIDAGKLYTIETALYGSASVDPHIPSLDDLYGILGS